LVIIAVIAAAVIFGVLFLFVISPKEDSATNQELAVFSESIRYYGPANGFLARPAKDGDYPGVIMVHEWWGLNSRIKDQARELAKEGYIVLAVDLFRGEVAETPERANELVGEVVQEEALENMKIAADWLRSKGVSKIASLGWCFGGRKSLELALSGEELAATVIYYGQPETDIEKVRAINWPVLGIFGGKDSSIPVTSVREFESALNSLGVYNEIYIYPEVGHAFANPSGDNYRPEEAKDAWIRTMTFLKERLSD